MPIFIDYIMIKIGDNINGYTFIRKIGEGGMGAVWEVVKEGKSYAIKTCNSTDENNQKRFEREFRLMNCLDNPYVLKAFEQGQLDDGTKFLVEELGESSLKEVVEKGLTTKQKYDFCIQICEGLAYIHQKGETHRDIKADNILLVNGIAKIADFGIGRFLERDTTTLTTTTESLGTYGYAAPELYDKGKFREGSKAIDIYALGSLLYYIFSDGSLPQFFNYKQVSADIYPILSRCRENDVAERYQSVDDVLKAIRGVAVAKNRYKSMTELYKERSNLSPSEWIENAIPILFASQGIGEILSNFQFFSYNWNAIKKNIRPHVDDIIRLIIKVFEEDKNYWIQFEDTEIMAKMAVLLCPMTSDIGIAIKLLDLSLRYSISANRWDALRTLHNDLFSKWDETTIQPYISYIQGNIDLFKEYAEIINVGIPPLVRNSFKEE